MLSILRPTVISPSSFDCEKGGQLDPRQFGTKTKAHLVLRKGLGAARSEVGAGVICEKAGRESADDRGVWSEGRTFG